MQDFIQNGQGFGTVGAGLADVGYDTGMLRPYFLDIGNANSCRRVECVTLFNAATQQSEVVTVVDAFNRGMSQIIRNATTLRKDEWIEMDKVLTTAARPRLRAWGDLESANSMTLDGMSSSILEYETLSTAGKAVVDMTATSEGNNDGNQYLLGGLPLPITHDDFFFDERRLRTSRKSGTPLDMTRAADAGRNVAETIERTLIGAETGITYAGNTVYGYTNFPDRLTKTDMTAPTGSNGSTVQDEWLEIIADLAAVNRFGNFTVYVSTAWDRYLDNVFSTTEPSAGTLREMLMKIDQIDAITRLDYFPPTSTGAFDLVFVQHTADVARAINGLELTTVQWPTIGGLQQNFKVMAIKVPNLRSDFNESTGIAHGSVTV